MSHEGCGKRGGVCDCRQQRKPCAIERNAVMDLLAPNGAPIFEWGHETTPTEGDIRRLAEEIVSVIEHA